MLAMAAGADFIKTSTGKIGTSATLPVALCMAEAIRDFAEQTGRPSGSRSPAASAPRSRRGSTSSSCSRRSAPSWLTPDRFRLGASSLLNDVLMQLRTQQTGRYQSADELHRLMRAREHRRAGRTSASEPDGDGSRRRRSPRG